MVVFSSWAAQCHSWGPEACSWGPLPWLPSPGPLPSLLAALVWCWRTIWHGHGCRRHSPGRCELPLSCSQQLAHETTTSGLRAGGGLEVVGQDPVGKDPLREAVLDAPWL